MVDGEDIKDEEVEERSYRSETPDNLDTDMGPALDRHIVLQRSDDTPMQPTWVSIDMMMANRYLVNNVTFRIPFTEECPWSPPDGFIYLYESFFSAVGLWISLPLLLVEYCRYCRIAISQLMHATIRNFMSVLALSVEVGFDIDRRFFEEMASFKRCKNGSGRFYASMKSKYNFYSILRARF